MQTTPVFLTSDFPYPSHGGAKIRDASLIRVFIETFGSVELVCFESGTPKITAESALPPEISSRIRVHWVRRERDPLWKKWSYPFRPYFLNLYQNNVSNLLREFVVKGRLLWISRLGMAPYIPLGNQLGYVTVLDEHNAESDLYFQSIKSSLRYVWEWPIALQLRYYEKKFCEAASGVTATSTRDQQLLSRLAPSQKCFAVLPNSIDTAAYSEMRRSAGEGIVFLGTLDYLPNIEGLRWFNGKVLPHLQRKCKKIVAGSQLKPDFKAELEKAGWKILLNPKDSAVIFAKAKIFLVPLLSGGGTRIKIIEAMAAGRAIVSTSKGAEGLAVTHGQDIYLADSPEEFAIGLSRLLEDHEFRQSIGQSAVETAQKLYDWHKLIDPFRDFMQELGCHPVQFDSRVTP